MFSGLSRERAISEISECGSLLPLFLPLTRQRFGMGRDLSQWMIRQDRLRPQKAATSRGWQKR